MSREIQVFKGGFESNYDIDGYDRLAPNQRPADGHQKAGSHESYKRINATMDFCSSPTCSKSYKDLKVGDVIAVHTTLTFGQIQGFGLAVLTPEKGLKFRVVTRDHESELSDLVVFKFKYDEEQGKFVQELPPAGLLRGAVFDASDNYYYGVYMSTVTGGPRNNTCAVFSSADIIGLEIVSLPDEGLSGEFDIETRLQMIQPVRPPAHLHCC